MDEQPNYARRLHALVDDLEGWASETDGETPPSLGFRELATELEGLEGPRHGPRLAGRVEITRTRSAEGNRHEITVDGEPFPFYVALAPVEVQVGASAPMVRLSIMAEELVVRDTIGTELPSSLDTMGRRIENTEIPLELERGRRIENTEIHDRLAGKGEGS